MKCGVEPVNCDDIWIAFDRVFTYHKKETILMHKLFRLAKKLRSILKTSIIITFTYLPASFKHISDIIGVLNLSILISNNGL